MGGHPDGPLTDLRIIRMVEVSRRQRRMEASSEGGHGPKVTSTIDGMEYSAVNEHQVGYNLPQLKNIKSVTVFCN